MRTVGRRTDPGLLRLRQLSGRVLTGLQPYQDRLMWQVEVGSQLAADDHATAPYQLSVAARAMLASSADGLTAAIALAKEGVASVAPFTLLHAGLESSATALWLLHPRVPADRLTRRLRLAAVEARHASQARFATGQAEPPLLTEQLRVIRDTCRRGSGDVQSVSSPPPTSTLLENADRVLRSPWHYLLAWRICGGLAMGQPWASAALAAGSIAAGIDAERDATPIRSPADRLAWALGSCYDLTRRATASYTDAARPTRG